LAGWGSTDGRYPRNEPPQADEAWSGVAWRGQRVSAQLLLWTRTGAAQVRLAPEPLRSPSGSVIPAAAISARFVRYVLADGKLVPDVLDTARRLDLGQETVRPVWVAIEVPADARPGLYAGSLTVRAQDIERLALALVLAMVLAPYTLRLSASMRKANKVLDKRSSKRYTAGNHGGARIPHHARGGHRCSDGISPTRHAA